MTHPIATTNPTLLIWSTLFLIIIYLLFKFLILPMLIPAIIEFIPLEKDPDFVEVKLKKWHKNGIILALDVIITCTKLPVRFGSENRHQRQSKTIAMKDYPERSSKLLIILNSWHSYGYAYILKKAYSSRIWLAERSWAFYCCRIPL